MRASRASANTTNIYLRDMDGNPMNQAPLVMPYNGTIINISASSNTAGPGAWSAEVRDNGTLIAGAVINMTAVQTSNFGTYSVNVNAGALLMIFMTGTSIDRPAITVLIKRR